MITLVKVNLLTDDAAIPSEFREALTSFLRGFIEDDPEGSVNARVSLEWKHTVHNRDYMATLPATAHAERITLPAKKEKRNEALECSSSRRRPAAAPTERARGARVGRASHPKRR